MHERICVEMQKLLSIYLWGEVWAKIRNVARISTLIDEVHIGSLNYDAGAGQARLMRLLKKD
ncbi:hypothetical protein GCM10010486_79870 [Nonomuraea roseoviolacea subsp. carminata]